jgi:hypothetical protein
MQQAPGSGSFSMYGSLGAMIFLAYGILLIFRQEIQYQLRDFQRLLPLKIVDTVFDFHDLHGEHLFA